MWRTARCLGLRKMTIAGFLGFRTHLANKPENRYRNARPPGSRIQYDHAARGHVSSLGTAIGEIRCQGRTARSRSLRRSSVGRMGEPSTYSITRYSGPTSNSVATLGWLSAAMACAFAPRAVSEGRICELQCHGACQAGISRFPTSPMPPVPSGATSSGPKI